MTANRSGRARKRGDDCLQRVPYASVMAALLCCVGVALFSVMMAWAFTASVEQARRALNTDSLPWLDKVQIFFIAVAVLMGIATLMLLTVGTMSTGSTRDELYSGVRGQMGGRVANGFALISAYVLNVCWLLCFACTAILCFIYYAFNSLCSSLTDFSDSNCLDFGAFRPLFQRFSSSSLRLCGGDLQEFCALSSSAFAWYVVGLVGTFLTIKGLVHFLICCSANYAHVSSGTKYADLREVSSLCTWGVVGKIVLFTTLGSKA
ncbi:unnamed protein product [Toxocara canis]|uniref:Amastin surface glycofamily protein n=1 Tax=Toxocara canis TaxID=6265 RepID=A0A183UFH8_TOXCA|nr:unnamed protein product [Toxocara canis]